MRKIIARLAVVLVPLMLMAGTGVASAHQTAPSAKRFTFQAVCDTQGTKLCAYSDGTSGHDYFGKLYSEGTNAENMTLTAVIGPCGNGISKVQDGGDGDDNCSGLQVWWPATGHGLDSAWGAGNVGTFSNTKSGLCAINTTVGLNVTQGDCGDSGHLWVAVPNGNSAYEFNVLASDNSGTNPLTEVALCANGQDNPLITDDWQTLSGCGASQSHINWVTIQVG